MNHEKIESRRKGSNIFCCDVYMYSKNNEYKNKIDLRFLNKDFASTAYNEFGKFFINQKHDHTGSFAEMEKRKIEVK